MNFVLPNLSKLSLLARTPAPPTLRQRWLDACGSRMPAFKRWKKLRGADKFRLLHHIALASEDDARSAAGQYLGPYTEIDVDDIIAARLWSVEHVLPRSMVNGRAPGRAEDDPLGWVVATRGANSRRSNLPLVLWIDGASRVGGADDVATHGGEMHYVPPERQRARLARKWLYLRATYSDLDNLSPPTAAQRARIQDIIDLARDAPVGVAEQRAHDELVRVLGGGWRNPLLTREAGPLLSDPEFKALLV